MTGSRSVDYRQRHQQADTVGRHDNLMTFMRRLPALSLRQGTVEQRRFAHASRAHVRGRHHRNAASPIVDILEQRRIETWFQPVFLRRNGLVLWGYECLMRARDVAGEIISAGQLLEWAERENLLANLDRICRERHIENAALAGAATSAGSSGRLSFSVPHQAPLQRLTLNLA